MIKSVKYQREHPLSDPDNKYVVITTEIIGKFSFCHEDNKVIQEWVAKGNTIEPADE